MKNMMGPLLALVFALSACGDKDAEAPTGQVVATVDGKEITNNELRAEMGPAAGVAEAQEPALRSVISRYILADAAIEQGLDKTPEIAMLKKKADQLVLVEALTRKIRDNVPPPSDEEIRQYVSERPLKFSQRKIFVVDQVVVDRVTPELIKAIEPLDTLDEITAMLTSKGIEYRSTLGALDALSLPDEVLEKIAGMPNNFTFAVPDNGMLRINQIKETVTKPVNQQDAERAAKAMLTSQRTQKLVAQRLNDIVQKDMPNVKYNKDFAPKNPKAPAAGNSAAAGNAAAATETPD